MMRTIPPFRLPDAIIQRDIDRILELGVELILNARVTERPSGCCPAVRRGVPGAGFSATLPFACRGPTVPVSYRR